MEQYNISLLSYLYSVNSSSPLLIIGDLNLPNIDWSTYSGTTDTSNVYAEMAYDLNLLQLIYCPTHQTGNILDVILTNYDYCQSIGIQSDLPRGLSSDHYIISFYFQPPAQHRNLAADSPKHIYNYSKANWEGMNQFFHSYNFDQCLHSDNVEFIWDQLKRAIYSTQSLCIPFLPVRSINQPK